MSTTSPAGVLPTRPATAKEQAIIDDVLKLYQLRPSEQAYSHYAQDAMFHDPVSIAKGLDSIKSQFNGMPKLFARSETKEVSVLEASTPKSLQLNLDQHYVFKSASSILPGKDAKGGMEKTVNSKITLNMNEQGMIREHHEEWDHAKNKTGDEDGFVGKLMEWRKKAGAKLVEAAVSSDPAKV